MLALLNDSQDPMTYLHQCITVFMSMNYEDINDRLQMHGNMFYTNVQFTQGEKTV